MGIGLMMVGILAYMLPDTQQASELVPAIGGVIMALGGWITLHREHLRKHLMHMNALIALLLCVGSVVKIAQDWHKYTMHESFLVADLDVLALTAVFLYYAIKSFKEARRKR